VSLTTRVSALTADLAAAKDEIVMYTEDLQAAIVRGAAFLCVFAAVYGGGLTWGHCKRGLTGR
jgi:hypothetical protein